MKLKTFLIALLCSLELFSGFAGNALVKVNDGYEQIQELKIHDKILTVDRPGFFIESSVSRVMHEVVDQYVVLLVEDELIICGTNQFFYLFDKRQWCNAGELKVGDQLCSRAKQLIKIQYVELVNEPIELFDLRVKGQHTFCISSQEILVHNFSFLIGFAWALGGGAEFQGISVALSLFGVWLYGKLFQDSGGNGLFQFCNKSDCFMGCPDPEDPEEKKKRKYHG